MSEDYGRWCRRFEAARKDRGEQEWTWRRIYRHMAGRNYRRGWLVNDKGASERGSPVNLLNNFRRVVLPHLLPRDRRPEVKVSPQRPGPEYAASAERLEDRLNALIPQIRLLDHYRRAMVAALYAEGWVKVGFHARVGRVEPRAEATAGGEDAGGAVDVDRAREEGQEYLDAGLPFARYVNPFRVLIDPGATGLEDADWIAHELYLKAAAVRADPRFVKFADRLQPTHSRAPRSAQEERSAAGRSSEKGEGVVQILECYDRDRGRICWYAGKTAGVDDMLHEAEWPAGIEGFPFDRIDYESIDELPWLNSVLAPVYDLMWEVDAMYARAAEQAAASRRVVLYDPEFVKPEQIAKVVSARDLEVVPLQGLAQHVQVVELGGVTRDHWELLDRARGLADDMSGVGEFLRGTGASSPQPTATEVSAKMQASGVRMDDLRATLYQAMGRTCQKLAALLIAHAEMMGDVQLPLGDPAEARFVALGGSESVVGEALEYAYEIVATSVERVDPAIAQKRTADLIAQSVDPNLGQKLQQEGKRFLTAPLLERHLRGLGEKNASDYLRDIGPDPAIAEQESARAAEEDRIMLGSGEPLPVGPNDDHAAHLAVHQQDLAQLGGDPEHPIALHAMMHEQMQAPAEGGEVGGGGPPAGGAGGTGEQLGALRREAGPGAAA